jgi:iron complex outermembrane receptor protein
MAATSRSTCLPSEVISGADVMKSAQASQIEGSIGGSVNLRSARPLDYPGTHASVRAEGDHNDLSQKNGKKISGVYSQTFANNTLGVMLGAVYSKRTVRTDSLQSQTFDADSPGSFDANKDGKISTDESKLLAVCCIAFGSVFEQKERAALSGAFEWKPSSDFRLSTDFLVTRLDAPQIGYNQAYYVKATEGRWSDVVIKDHLVTSMTVADMIPEIANITSNRVVDTKQYGVKANWRVTNDLTLVGDAYRSTSVRNSGGKDSYVVAGIAGNNTGYYTLNDNALPSIRVTLQDGRDLATAAAAGALSDKDYGPHYAGLSGTDVRDQITGVSADGKWSLSGAWFADALNFGLANTSRSKTRNFIGNDQTGGSCQYCGMYSTTFASLGAKVVNTVTVPNYMNGAGGSFPMSFIAFDVPAYFAGLKSLDGKPVLDADGVPTGAVFNSAASQAVLDPTNSYHVTEDTITGYGQLDLSGEKWSGNIGARLVRTRTRSQSAINRIISIVDKTPDIATSSPIVTYSNASPVTEEGTYTKLLPSANLSYLVTPALTVRAALAKVMARPSLDKLAATRTDSTLDRTYTINIAGDPKLKPTEAVQQDLSVEWYYKPKSALTAAVFAKQIKNFITYQTDEHVDIGVPGYLYTVTHPVNGDTAKVLGMELGAQHFFDNGFGLNAKFTKTNTKAYSGGVYTGQLEGVAPSASSVAFLYEAHGVNAQLAFDYTGKYTQSSNVVAGYPALVDPITWVTASVSYEFAKNLTVFIEGKNLSDAKMRSTLGRSDAAYGFEAWGRTFVAGLSAKF